MTYDVTVNQSAPKGKKELLFNGTTNPAAPCLTKFTIDVQDRVEVQVRWRFPEVPGETWGRTTRNANFFHSNYDTRATARDQFAQDVRKYISIYLSQAGLQNPSPMRPGAPHPPGPGYEQAIVDFYDISIASNGAEEDRNYFPATWFEPTTRWFNAGTVTGLTFADSEHILEAQQTKNITGSLNVYFVNGIVKFDNGVLSISGGWTVLNDGTDRRLTLISDQVTDPAVVGQLVAHELGHAMGIDHPENPLLEQIPWKPAFSEINNPTFLVPAGESANQWNLMFGNITDARASYLTNGQATRVWNFSQLQQWGQLKP